MSEVARAADWHGGWPWGQPVTLSVSWLGTGCRAVAWQSGGRALAATRRRSVAKAGVSR